MRAKLKKCKGVCEFQNKEIEIIDISTYQAPKVPSKQWRELIKKIWEVDPLICPRCSGEMKIIALLDDREIIEKILKHLKLWSEPAPDTARGSPESVIPDNIYEPFYDDLQLIPEEKIS